MFFITQDNSTARAVSGVTVAAQRIALYLPAIRGRLGFDTGYESLGACRGADFLVKPAATNIVANDDNYALAA